MQTTNTLPTYMFANIDREQLNEVLRKLKEIECIHWFGTTSGRYDVVASFRGNDMQKTYAAINQIRSIKGVVSTTSLFPFEGQTNQKKNGGLAMGEVLRTVDKPVHDVLQSLKNVAGVSEPSRYQASGTY
jgi:uncharacterized protein with GYD domain